jgi:hypothetical protein
MEEKKILFLFGAGASYGCNSVVPYKPPLGKDLYRNLLKEESCIFWRYYHQYFPEDILSEFDNNFESAFSKLVDIYDKISGGSEILKGLHVEIANYLFKFDVSENYNDNNYYRLIVKLKQNDLLGKIDFASLNYDCIFEKLLSKMRVDFCYYLGNNREIYRKKIKVFKPHGSSNFVVRRSNFDAQWVSIAASVNLDLPIEALHYHTFTNENNRNHRSNLWPVMALYNFKKEHRICFTSIKNIRKELAYKIHQASHIILIGVRYVENDKHIWNPINYSKGKLIYYGNDLNGFQRKRNVFIIDERFDKSCESFMQYI